ncbi:MAG TPA: TlyA family RNA methyltransferase [Polyangiaceae bacterium]|nr:TlyA family RNA methyltransferase [Polyangiaceae bacterium]
MTFDKPRREKKRADQLLVDRGLATSRASAQALILAGEVFVDDLRVDKAGTSLPVDAPLRVRDRNKYVSRGGLKLEGALEDLAVAVGDIEAADIGASTGGFTDCLLAHGARRVHAVDVGHGQLAAKLRSDPRVVVLERTNARTLTPDQLGGPVDLVVVDASFISLEKLLPALFGITRPGGRLLALIKPQFEVGREEATRGAGVVRDELVRTRAVDKVLAEVDAAGYTRLGDVRCRVAGPKGNVEHFVLARRPEP